MKILITSTNCSINKGSAAQILSTMKILKTYIPGAEYTLLSRIPDLDEEQRLKHLYDLKIVGYSGEIHSITRQWAYRNVKAFARSALFAFANKIGLNPSFLLRERMVREYFESDLILNLSGDSYSDGRGGNGFINSLEVLIGFVLGKPVVFFSQSIGPFNNASLPLAKYCLKRAALITVREEITQQYLAGLGIHLNVHLAADCAFALDPASSERVKEILAKEGINPEDKPIVGFSLSAMLDDADNRYASLMAQLADYVVEKTGATLVFIPHVVAQRTDDRVMGKKVFDLVKNKAKIHYMQGDYDPRELKGTISLSEVFIGGRMHANIAALSSGVPTMATAWSHKYYGIMQSLGQEHFVCDYRTMEFDDLKQKFDELWETRDRIRETLRGMSEQQYASAMGSGALVDELIRSGTESSPA